MRAQFVFQEVWTGLRRNLTMTIALVVVVAISLSLLGTGLLFVKQVDNTRTYWQGKVEISVYLCTSTSPSTQCRQNGPATASQIAAIGQNLRSLPEVEHVYYQSQAQAYQNFKQDFSQDPSFVSTVSPGEIPNSFEVKLKNPDTDFSVVADTVQGRPGVDDIVDDRSILNNFYNLLDAARNAVVITAIILIVAAALLVANTIRLSAFNRRRETSIMRLFGGLIAAGLLVAVKNLGLDTLQSYFTFNVKLSLSALLEVIFGTMLVGVVLCGLTSFLTLRRYLRV